MNTRFSKVRSFSSSTLTLIERFYFFTFKYKKIWQHKIQYQTQKKKYNLHFEGLTTADVLGGTSTTQSYDFMCIVPKRSLLNTVIPGWLWSGMALEGGKQKIPICDNWKLEHSSQIQFLKYIQESTSEDCIQRIFHIHGYICIWSQEFPQLQKLENVAFLDWDQHQQAWSHLNKKNQGQINIKPKNKI
jgi:hypothetical protein